MQFFQRSQLLATTFILSICLLSRGNAADNYFLFKKNEFLIHYVSNGGNCVDCEWIAIEGEIPPNAGELFEKYVTKHQLGNYSMNISFNSPGGSLVGAIWLGRAIRQLKYITSIEKTVPDDAGYYTRTDGKCTSACAYAFLGGVNRRANAGEYGVHQFYTDALLKDPEGKVFSPIDFSVQQTLTGLLLSYIMEMGVDPALVVEANSTPPTEMNFLSDDKLRKYKVEFDP